MITLKNMTDEEMSIIHQQYIQFQSLNKTVAWLKKEKQIDINRHQLSMLFKKRNLTVLPANGRTVGEWRVSTKHESPESELGAHILRAAVADVTRYIKGSGELLDYLTACAFFTSKLYDTIIKLLSKDTLDGSILPQNITHETVMFGNEIYNRQMAYWVNL